MKLPKNSLEVAADCQESLLNEGLISATGNVTGNTGNASGICVTGTQEASYREFKVPTYQNLEDQFYSLNRSGFKKTTPPPQGPAGTLNFSALGNGVYLQPAAQTPLNVNAVTGSGVQVIFVQGDLNITGNIDYGATDIYSGLVFIVRDNINIYSNVTLVNAVLVSTGIICTSYVPGSGCVNGSNSQQLVINGSLISLNKSTLPPGQNAIELNRNLTINDRPAEVVNKQAKFLYILRNGILTRDLIITTEDQHYDIPGMTTPPPPVPNQLPAASCSPIPVIQGRTSIINNLIISECIYQPG